MTRQRFILWLHRIALALLCALGAVMAFCIIAGLTLGLSPVRGLDNLRALRALAALFGWAGGLTLIAIALWAMLEALLAGFAGDEA